MKDVKNKLHENLANIVIAIGSSDKEVIQKVLQSLEEREFYLSVLFDKGWIKRIFPHWSYSLTLTPSGADVYWMLTSKEHHE